MREALELTVGEPFLEIMEDRRAIIRRKHHCVTADRDIALGIARMLHVLRRRGGAQAPRQAAGKAHPFALDVATRVAKEFKPARELAKLDPNLFEQRLSCPLDRLPSLLTNNF